ncbi:Uncharacterised protein [Mycobacteroides abscessus subsp. abscessus]|nr:Uncharacterised protein [Mycobacteroides abscessus subsp. abscessus]
MAAAIRATSRAGGGPDRLGRGNRSVLIRTRWIGPARTVSDRAVVVQFCGQEQRPRTATTARREKTGGPVHSAPALRSVCVGVGTRLLRSTQPENASIFVTSTAISLPLGAS